MLSVPATKRSLCALFYFVADRTTKDVPVQDFYPALAKIRSMSERRENYITRSPCRWSTGNNAPSLVSCCQSSSLHCGEFFDTTIWPQGKRADAFLVSGATERHHVPQGTRLILSVDISFFNGAFLFFRQKTFALQHEYTPTKGELPCALTALQ